MFHKGYKLMNLEDPNAWGYRPLNGRTSFVPDHEKSDPPFELSLVGSGHIEVPEELAYMVTVHHDLDYEAFYKLIAGMDIVVPAFIDFGCKRSGRHVNCQANVFIK